MQSYQYIQRLGVRVATKLSRSFVLKKVSSFLVIYPIHYISYVRVKELGGNPHPLTPKPLVPLALLGMPPIFR